MSAPGPLSTRRSWLDRLLVLVVALLALGFIVAFSGRSVTILSGAALDDALFIRLGQALAAGDWLGKYDQNTLVKGPGLPAFLAISNLLGLPYGLSVTLFHTACAGFAAWVVRHVTGSRIAGVALFAALLLMPLLYFGAMLRVTRDIFYTSLTIALVAAAMALATRRALGAWTAAILTGVLGAWWWLTREEGVWLLPAFAVLALAPLLTRVSPGVTRGRWVARAWQYAPPAAAVLTGFSVVVAVGLINWAVYGSFVVNEIKDRSFAGALEALQAASAPYHRDKVPVPRAARPQIYAVSPAFAELRKPVLDGDLAPAYLADSCAADKRMCGEFGAGWFMWVFRTAAATDGQHASPGKAKAFYSRIAREVRQGCHDGRLQCAGSPIPLAPQLRADDLDEVASAAGRLSAIMTFNDPVATQPDPSDLSAPDGDQMYAFLNRPLIHDTEPVKRTLRGWFRLTGPQYYAVEPSPGVAVTKFIRHDSPDLAVFFKDPGLTRHRYELFVECRTEQTCPVTVRLEDGSAWPVDLAALKVGPTPVGAATLYVDENVSHGSETVLRSKFSQAWVKFASRLNGAFRGLLAAGALAFAGLVAHAIAVRRISLALVVCTALLAGVAARVTLLAVIDAVAFWATGYGYALPGVPLLLIAAIIALAEAARLIEVGVRRPAAAPTRPPAPPPAAPAH